jgi:hypothetical protein
VIWFKSFLYRAASWKTARRVAASRKAKEMLVNHHNLGSAGAGDDWLGERVGVRRKEREASR